MGTLRKGGRDGEGAQADVGEQGWRANRMDRRLPRPGRGPPYQDVRHEEGGERLAGDGTRRGGAGCSYTRECQHHRCRSGRDLDPEGRARKARTLDATAVPKPRRLAYQAVPHWDREARPVVDPGD